MFTQGKLIGKSKNLPYVKKIVFKSCVILHRAHLTAVSVYTQPFRMTFLTSGRGILLKLKENISLVNSIDWVTWPVTSDFATSDPAVSESYFWLYIKFLFLVKSDSYFWLYQIPLYQFPVLYQTPLY